MAYTCKDCSYRGKKGGPSGECPACGSFNLVLEGASGAGPSPAPGKFRVPLLIVSWAVFLGLITWKLIH